MSGYGGPVLSILLIGATLLLPVLTQTSRPHPHLPPNEQRSAFPVHLKSRFKAQSSPDSLSLTVPQILEAGSLRSGSVSPSSSSISTTHNPVKPQENEDSDESREASEENDEDEMWAQDTILYSRRPVRPSPPTTYYPAPLITARPTAPIITARPTAPTTMRPTTTTTRPTPPSTTSRPTPPPITSRPNPPLPAQLPFSTTTPRPIGPPGTAGTDVPILVGGHEVLPPSPPTEEVFPPSPPVRSPFSSRQLPPVRRPVAVRRPNARTSIRPVQTTTTPDPNIITDYVFSDIKCYRTKQKEYFGAKIHMRSGFHLPYIRDRPDDPMTSHECHMDRTDVPDTFQLKMTDLTGCGVEQCGDSMCVTMVFPRLPMLALADDEVTTIKCAPQKSSISEHRTISFVGDSLETRHSGSTVEGGGQDFAAEVGVFRQNAGMNNGLFVKRINSGGVVQLGEPLQLRSVVRGGDGWTFSRLTDVKVWRMREGFAKRADEELNPKDASEVITLVDSGGCRNNDYQVIAETDPLRDPRNDLVHHFTFKAFLFRGQRASEPLIVTAKVQACQERDDCDVTDCKGDEEIGRFRRSAETESPRNRTRRSQDWSSQLALRVVGHESQSAMPTEPIIFPPRVQISEACVDKMAIAAVIGSFLMLLLATLVSTLVSFCQRGRRIQKRIKASTAQHPATPTVQQPARAQPADTIRAPSQMGTENGTQLASLLEQLQSDNPGADGGGDKDVYILYCPQGRTRARSAPPVGHEEGDSGDEEWTRESGKRRTVRSVKRSQRRREEGRKSFPSRIKGRDVFSGTQSVRQSRSKVPKGREPWEESHVSSEDPESAYCSSSGSASSEIVRWDPDAPPPLPPPNPKPRNKQNINMSHYVTRKENNSTQIIIIPETNV